MRLLQRGRVIGLRLATAAGFFLVGACGSAPTTDAVKDPVFVPVDPLNPIHPIHIELQTDGWETASTPAPAPAVREVMAELELPHRSPTPPVTRENPVYNRSSTGRALVSTAGSLYVVDSDNGWLNILDRTSGQATRRIYLGSMPEHVVVAQDGTAFVTLRHGHAVARIGPESFIPTLAQVGTEPMGLALSPDEERLYVTVRGDNALVALDTTTMSELARFDSGLDRPNTVIVNPSGRIFVGGRSNRVTPLEFHTSDDGFGVLTVLTRVQLRLNNPTDLAFHAPIGLVANRVMAATLDSKTQQPLFLHNIARAGNEESFLNGLLAPPPVDPPPSEPDEPSNETDEPPENESGYGQGGVKSDFPDLLRSVQGSVTRLAAGSAVQTSLPVLDPLTGEPMEALIAQPSDIHHHPNLSLAFVTGYGSDNVLVLNTRDADPMASPLGIIRVGKAPKAITFSPDGQLAYVLNAHDFTVSEIDITPFFGMTYPIESAQDQSVGLEPLRLEHSREVVFGTDPLPESARLGRRIFTYAFNDKLSRDNQFACRSCHIDGSEDGIVWMIGDGPRQTPALAGRLHDTAPFNWVGSEGELQNNMNQTIERMGGHGLDSEELASLEEFLLVGLTPPPNPNLRPGGLTAAQKRGQKLFNAPIVGCATCHVGTAMTDGKLHDVGTNSEVEFMMVDLLPQFDGEERTLPKFNTPSLRGLHATAPYLHDGSAPTLHDVLTRTGNTMGKTDHLTNDERDDLVAYLLTL